MFNALFFFAHSLVEFNIQYKLFFVPNTFTIFFNPSYIIPDIRYKEGRVNGTSSSSFPHLLAMRLQPAVLVSSMSLTYSGWSWWGISRHDT